MEITAPIEWSRFCSEELNKAKKKIARQLYKKYGDSVLFPMFLHMDLCNAMHSVFVCAPTREESLRFINQALEEVKDNFKDKE